MHSTLLPPPGFKKLSTYISECDNLASTITMKKYMYLFSVLSSTRWRIGNNNGWFEATRFETICQKLCVGCPNWIEPFMEIHLWMGFTTIFLDRWAFISFKLSFHKTICNFGNSFSIYNSAPSYSQNNLRKKFILHTIKFCLV